MKIWTKPEIENLEIKSTEVTYEQTPSDMAMWGKYRYWDGVKYVYVDNIPDNPS